MPFCLQKKRTPRFLHGKDEVQVHRVARAQLWLLLVLGAKDITDAIQQLQVALVWFGSQTKLE